MTVPVSVAGVVIVMVIVLVLIVRHVTSLHRPCNRVLTDKGWQRTLF